MVRIVDFRQHWCTLVSELDNRSHPEPPRHALDFRPPLFRDESRLVWLAEVSPPTDEQCPGCPVQTSDAMAATPFAGSRSSDATAAMEWTEYSRGAGDVVERLLARRATPHLLRFLGMAPALGREFLDDDTTGTAHDVALISYDFWQREFSGRQDVVGMLLRPSSELGADHARSVFASRSASLDPVVTLRAG